MKKAFLIVLSVIFLQMPVLSANKKMVPNAGTENHLPNIFIYSIPDDEPSVQQEKPETPISSSVPVSTDEEITLDDNETISATVLKGFAEYIEDSNVIYLKDTDDNYILNIKVPQKISASDSLNIRQSAKPTKKLLQYKDAEYAIAPGNLKTSGTAGNFTFGALYNTEVDNIAMLEEETGLFTKYEKNRFALSSSFKKSLNTTYAKDYNTISLTPEFKLNNYMSLKNVLSADITRNRRSSKVVFSVNPYGSKDIDRLRFELGAKQTILLDSDTTKTEFSFSTIFKL